MSSRDSGRIAFGLLIVFLGLLFLAGNLELWPHVSIGAFWPVAVIVFGVAGMLNFGHGGFSWFRLALFGLITAFGVLALLDNLHLVRTHPGSVFGQFWPVFILAFGLDLLFGSGRRSRRSGHGTYRYGGRGGDGSWHSSYWTDRSAGSHTDTEAEAVRPPVTGEPAAGATAGAPAPEGQHAKPGTPPAGAAPAGGDAGDKAGDWSSSRRGGPSGRVDVRNRMVGEMRLGSRPWDLDPNTVINMGAGELDIDLCTARIGPGENVLSIRLWAGQVSLYVPANLAIDADVRVGAGEIVIFGEHNSGLGQSLAYCSDNYETAERKVRIVIDMMFGQASIIEGR